jgi:signal peptidase I
MESRDTQTAQDAALAKELETGAPPASELDTIAPVPAPDATPITPPPPSTSGHIGRAVLREIVETIVLFAVIFTIARVTIGNFIIIGQSMEPNYHEQQRLLVDRVSHGLGWLQRGDVVILHSPDEPIDLIKRLIGLPGDTVEIRDNHVFVNGQQLNEPYLPADADTSRGLADGRSTWTLGADEYLMMGDNRSASKDGRYFGPVKYENLIGRALLVYYPFKDFTVVRHHKYE